MVRRTGRFVHVAYNQEAERMGIYVVSQEERKNELNGDKFLLCPVSHRFNILHNHSANKWLCINRKEGVSKLIHPLFYSSFTLSTI